jgi:hypothetical protein
MDFMDSIEDSIEEKTQLKLWNVKLVPSGVQLKDILRLKANWGSS